jgi:hypothetical protein
MPVESGDVEFRDVAETGQHLGVCLNYPEQAARVALASAAGPAPNLSEVMKTAPVHDTVPDASSSTAEPVTAVQHMDDDNDMAIDRQERCCHRTLRTTWSRLMPLRNIPARRTRTRSLNFHRSTLVQNAQS